MNKSDVEIKSETEVLPEGGARLALLAELKNRRLNRSTHSYTPKPRQNQSE